MSKIFGAEDIYKALKHMGDLDHEQVIIGVIDKKRNLIGVHSVGSGDHTGTMINTNAVNKIVIGSDPNAIIFIVHNHPSDDAVPSDEDVETTDYMKDICRVLNRTFADHVIIAKNQYYSFNTEVRTVYVSEDN